MAFEPMDARLTKDLYLSKAEEAHLVATLEKFRDRSPIQFRNTTFLLFQLKTGARPREALNLQWQDVDFTEATVYLRTLKKGNPRCLPLGQNLLARLKKLQIASPEQPFPFTIATATRVWHDYRPVKKLLYSLRHTFAVNFFLKASEINPPNALWLTKEALGHTAISRTSIYLQIFATADQMKAVIGD